MSAHFQPAHYGSSHFLSSHFGRGEIAPPFTPDDVPHPPGTSRDALIRRRIQEEEDMLMAVIRAFLHIRNR